MTEFTYNVEKHIATLGKSESGNITTELNLISYNGATAKIDIRKWDRTKDKMLKGVTLTNGEAYKLKKALEDLFAFEIEETTVEELLSEYAND